MPLPILIVGAVYGILLGGSVAAGKIAEAYEIHQAESKLLECEKKFQAFLASEKEKEKENQDILSRVEKEVAIRQSGQRILRFNSAANTVREIEMRVVKPQKP